MTETQSSKLSQLMPCQITNPDLTEEEHQAADRNLQEEVQTELEKDWSEIRSVKFA